jgi:branched-chain amino acid transport system substrate-binding protein
MTRRRASRYLAAALAVAALTPMAVKVLAEGCPAICPGGRVAIGISTAMTGPFAPFGQQMAAGARAAVAEINRAGGLLKVPVDAIVADDKCDPQTAASIASELGGKFGFVAGPACTGPALASAPVYAERGVLQIVPLATATELTRRGLANLFRLAPNDEQEVAAVAQFLSSADNQRRKVAIVQDATVYGQAVADGLAKALPMAARERVSSAQGDELQSLAARLLNEQVQLVYAAVSTDAAVRLSRVLRDKGVGASFVSGARLLSAAGAGNVLEGAVAVAPRGSLGAEGTPEYERAVGALKTVDATPNTVSLAGYAAIEVWAEAVRRADGGALAGVVQALRDKPLASAIGPIAFDARGDRSDPRFTLFRWSDGRFRELR